MAPDVTTGPAVRGFAVSTVAGDRSRCTPSFLQAGELIELAPTEALPLSGWIVARTGARSAADHLTEPTGDHPGVLFCGELYHRDALLTALELDVADTPHDSQPSDGSLVVAAWQKFGLSGLRLLNGRFAAVLGTTSGLLLVTDHAGSVPLYVTGDAHGWHLATEAKCLRADAPFAEAPFAEAPFVEAPFVEAPSGSVLPQDALVDVPRSPGLHRVRGARVVTLPLDSDGTPGRPVTASRTWTPPQHRSTATAERAVADVRRALDAAVGTRVGEQHTIVLSGGVDSSAVTALAASRHPVRTLTMGTEVADEFAAARVVADHLHTDHHQVTMRSADVLAALPWAVAAAEIVDAEVLEYLLPLVALARVIEPSTTLVTGYGADIPLGGMHRQLRDPATLDQTIEHEIAEVDVLNEMSPVVGGFAGHWTTHPYWDRDVLDLLLALPPGLKLREGTDKWVLRAAVADVLPASTAWRAKLGVHEGSGSQSAWTTDLLARGVPVERVAEAKNSVVARLFDLVVTAGVHPSEVDLDAVHDDSLRIDDSLRYDDSLPNESEVALT